jgi:hypothetical protein
MYLNQTSSTCHTLIWYLASLTYLNQTSNIVCIVKPTFKASLGIFDLNSKLKKILNGGNLTLDLLTQGH